MKLLSGGAPPAQSAEEDSRAEREREVRRWSARPRFTRAALMTAAHLETYQPGIEAALVQLALAFEAEVEHLDTLATTIGLNQILPPEVIDEVAWLNRKHPPLGLGDHE